MERSQEILKLSRLYFNAILKVQNLALSSKSIVLSNAHLIGQSVLVVTVAKTKIYAKPFVLMNKVPERLTELLFTMVVD